MRMPLSEFTISGDLKFIVVFIIFTLIATYHFIKKMQAKKSSATQELTRYHNAKIDSAACWILILSTLSLLLGLMRSFYFIGKAGRIAPNLIFQGVSHALITPVMGIGFYIISKILNQTNNLQNPNS
jgi:hypothetical protein